MPRITTTTKRTTRPAPVKRLTVTVKGKPYEALVDLYDASAPVMVASASTPGFWKVAREDGQFACTCPGFYHRRSCNHAAAALLADHEAAEAVREHRRPPHLDAAEYGAWLSSVDTGPDDDGWDHVLDEWADGIAAHNGPDWR